MIKPAHQTPLSMLALVDILREAGVPDGVVNVVATTSHSGQVMEPLIRSGMARKLSFTGSTAVGKMLLEQCADKVLRTSMELGGNAPFIVFEDADVDEAVAGAMAAKMRNMGEACTAANRIYVHESLIDEFGHRLAKRMAALAVGRGTEDGRQRRPADRRRGTGQGVRAGRRRRGPRRHGADRGQRPDGPGYFYPPTVLTGRDLAMRGWGTRRSSDRSRR